MKYIAIVLILILSSCTGTEDRVKRPLNDLIYDDKKIEKIKKKSKKKKKLY